jgi:hypothetical protein
MGNIENKKGFASLIERCKSDIPPFFKKLRAIGIALASVGTILVAAPIALPAGIITVGGYLIVAGSVAAAVAQTTTCEEEKK